MDRLFNQDTQGCHQDSVFLKTAEIMENLLTAELPEELDVMPDHLKDSFYPYDDRPEMILSDPDGNVQLTFQMLHKELKMEDIREAAEALRSCTERLYPRNEISPVCLYPYGESPTGWFFLEMELGDVSVHHVKAVRTVQGKFFLITATYPRTECMKWQAVLEHMFSTLQERSRQDAGSR